ncbi:hypothetical protein CXF85_08370 [Colwellia sp. 75C3]|uniref:hypothetical protein n=1 Tax=Colwellia sp. 75C3 TaxID=888425 RepID=UPI000C3307DE|nr:hypothetical protein [Colwellia sp. 75C3]PKG84470.1 hypothetical protein CXF85_08370 [Colwellia sp. 75C3]
MNLKNKKVWLGGGVGNKLFQLAYCFENNYTAIYPNKSEKISELTLGWSRHKDWLNILSIKAIVKIRNENVVDLICLPLLFLLGKKSNDYYIPECSYSIFCYEFGYFQHSKSISITSIEKVCIEVINKISWQPDTNNYSVFHFRGGDFLHENSLLQSGELVDSFLSDKREQLIVTNDVHTLGRLYPECRGLVAEGKSEVEDFKVLSNAKVVYVNDSTFLFWAVAIGVLNGKTTKVIISKGNNLLPLYAMICDNKCILEEVL